MPVARCLMEEVAWCAGERVRDRPAVTHPLLALLAQQVHDRTSVSGRPALLTQVPALLGARARDPRAGWALVASCARHALASDPSARVHRVADRLARRADRRTARLGWCLTTAGLGAAVRGAAPAIALARLSDLALALRCVLATAGPPGSAARDAALAELLVAATAAVRALEPAGQEGRVLTPA